MTAISTSLITDIRAASRDLVRQFGFLSQTVAGTELSASAVHAVIEIGLAGAMSSRELSDKLQLEKSTVSRLVKTLLQRGLVSEARNQRDQRVKQLQLTGLGRSTLQDIDVYAESQVSRALLRLNSDSRQCVLKGLRAYAAALSMSAPVSIPASTAGEIEIIEGYRPAIVARTVELMHLHMYRHFDFGPRFESRIATDIAEFMSRIDLPANASWRAQLGDDIVGVISIDGEDLGDGLAHLRWFVVAEAARGSGIGKNLLSRATAFCDAAGYRETHLWTVKGLDAARRLYESQGFALAEEYYGDQWGTRILEQRFVRPAGAGATALEH